LYRHRIDQTVLGADAIANFREHVIMQCMVFGRRRIQRSWQTGLLGVVKWRGVDIYLLETSV